MESLAKSKQQLRGHFKGLRNRLNGEIKNQLDERIGQKTLALLEKLSTGTKSVWTAYRPIQNEVDPAAIVKQTTNTIRWAFPAIQNDTLKFFIPAHANAFSESALGIHEPNLNESEELSFEDISGCLVPGVAFDRKGTRLGYGKGYYDRFLKTFKGHSVALAYDLQLSAEDLPCTEWDAPVQYIVTESSVITCSENA